ncbi:MAG: hypothetical protein WBJ90_02770, partial [Tepidanaerobacteraceae bacterium]
YNSIHKRSSFSMVLYADSIVSKSEDLLFFFILKMSYNYFTLCFRYKNFDIISKVLYNIKGAGE